MTTVEMISPALLEVPNGERGGDRRAADRGEQRQQEHHVQVRRGVLDDPRRAAPRRDALPRQAQRAHPVRARDRDLGGGEERHDEDQHDDDTAAPASRSSSRDAHPAVALLPRPHLGALRRPPRGRSRARAGCRARGAGGSPPRGRPGCSAPRPPARSSRRPAARTPSIVDLVRAGTTARRSGPPRPCSERAAPSISCLVDERHRQLGVGEPFPGERRTASTVETGPRRPGWTGGWR